MAQLRRHHHEIKSYGARLVLVGNGSVAQAAWFKNDQSVEEPIYTDPTLKVYERAHFRRDLGGLLAPQGILHAARALGRGHMQSGVKGDALQLGGTLLVDRGGELLWRHASETAGDHPSWSEVEAALKLLRPA